MTAAQEYFTKIRSGEILAGKWVRLAAERFFEDMKRDDLIWDVDSIERTTTFFEKVLCVPELGRPVPIPLPHAGWIQQLDGWKYKDTGLRRFTSAYVQMARKGFKSFYAAGYSVKELTIGNDKNPNILIGANSRDQAIICTELAGKIIKSSPQFRELLDSHQLEVFTYRKKTTEIVLETDSRIARIEAMPRDPGDGAHPSVGVIDEFHEANDTSLLETIQSGQGQRLEPLTLIITSPGHNKAAPCYSQLRYNSVLTLEKRVPNDRHLALMFELDDESEWDDMDMMEKSNPILPYSATLKPYLKDRIKEAKLYGGAKATNIKIKNSGVWVDSATVWIPSETINESNYGFSDEDTTGAECYVGIDLSTTTDLTAFAEFYPDAQDGKHALYVHSYVTQQKVDNKRDSVDYQKWAEEGWVTIHSGNALEGDLIAQDMMDRWDERDVRGIGYDKRFFNAMIAPHIKDTSYLELCDSVGQGFGEHGLSPAIMELEKWLLNGQIDLMGNPVLAWAFSCVELEVGKQGDHMPHKGKSNKHGRIDPVSASLTAIAKYLRNNAEPEKKKPFVIGI